MKERSLVLFTLAAQTAIGLLTWLAVSSSFGDVQSTNNRAISGWALALSLSAMLVSFLHLGSPIKAIHALRNLRTSWLSREVALAGTFTVCAGIVFFSTMLSFPAWQAWWTRLAALVGIALAYAMANVYQLRTAPGWSGPLTGPGFFLTGLLLGGSALAITTFTPEVHFAANTLFGNGLLLCLFLQTTIILLDHFYLARRDPGILPRKSTIEILRIAGLLASGLAWVYWNVLAGAGLILLSELFGRIEFYSRRSRVGL